MEQYRGPVPATDREYLVASYNLLAAITTKVSDIDKEVTRLKMYEIEPMSGTIARHDLWLKLVGAVGLPVVTALIVYGLNHWH